MARENEKLRIALVSNNYTPYSGGVVSSINAQIGALQGDHHYVQLITLDFLGDKHDDPEHVIRIKTPIKFKHREKHYAIPWFMVTQLKKIFRDIKPDIIHVHHPFLLGVKALEVGQKLGIPVIFTYHTLYEEYAHYVPLPSNLARTRISKLVKKFCGAVDGIIVPGQSIANHLKQQKISIPLNCIPSPLQSSFQNIPFIARKHSSLDLIRLLTVGRFTKEKNLSFILDACRWLDDRFILTLVGYGVEYESLRQYAYKELQLSPQQIRFVLKPSLEQLISYYQQADLFLFSSTTDTQGLVLAEAMACSTPVIAVHGPGQNDIIAHNKNGLLVSTPQEMAMSIKDLAEQNERLDKMCQEAWQTAQYFLFESFSKQLLSIYRLLIEK